MLNVSADGLNRSIFRSYKSKINSLETSIRLLNQ